LWSWKPLNFDTKKETVEKKPKVAATPVKIWNPLDGMFAKKDKAAVAQKEVAKPQKKPSTWKPLNFEKKKPEIVEEEKAAEPEPRPEEAKEVSVPESSAGQEAETSPQAETPEIKTGSEEKEQDATVSEQKESVAETNDKNMEANPEVDTEEAETIERGNGDE